MKRSLQYLSVASGFAVLAAMTAGFPTGRAVAQEDASRVKVVNRPEEWVPVSIQGSTAVSIANRPTVLFAPGSTVGINGEVAVANSERGPLLVKLLMDSFAWSYTFQVPAPIPGYETKFLVPAGKKLVVGYVSAAGVGTGAYPSSVAFLQIEPIVNGTASKFSLKLDQDQSAKTTVFSLSKQITIPADPGSALKVRFIRSLYSSQDVTLDVALSGTLEPSP